jgi:hypothetical protein
MSALVARGLGLALVVLAVACGGGGEGDDGGDDDDGGDPSCPAERGTPIAWAAEACPEDDSGTICTYGDETCACDTSWGTACTDCPVDEDGEPQVETCPTVGASCVIADVEHDNTCTCVQVDKPYVCCGDFAGASLCVAGCGDEVGDGCCADDEPVGGYECVGNAWVVI